MGLTISKIFDSILGKKELRILMLGLDFAGKTTILYKLKKGEVINSVPTIGFNIETAEYKNVRLSAWDLGGADRAVLSLGRYYYQDADALIYVVDSSDTDRLEEARKKLQAILAEDQLKDTALLVFANKQDIRGMSVAEVTEKLGLHELTNRNWFIQGSCATTGDGLYEGFDWIYKNTGKKQK